jgi:hypothetical protein
MTIPVWPETLPHLIVAGSFRILQPSRPPYATEFDDGPQRGRRSTTLPVTRVGFNLSFSQSEFSAFVAFWRDALVDGTQAFTMPIWVTARTYADHEVKFDQQNPWSTAGGKSGLIVEPSVVLDVTEWGG